MPDEITFPPYGMLHNDFAKDLPAPPPADWQPPSSYDGIDRVKAWKIWHRRRANEIADVLWPIFDRKEGEWIGKSKGKMTKLTKADLCLMLELQQSPPLDTLISSPGRSLDAPLQRAFFEEEDKFVPKFGVNYAFYDTACKDDAFRSVEQLFYRGLKTKIGASNMQWKDKFQRPRPYQTALLFRDVPEFASFTHEQAKSSLSPSLCSGHCLQGLLAVGAVMERHLLETDGPDGPRLAALGQYAVDIGDRRVMAGVHYPADNISSWILGMRLADRVYGDPRVKEQLAGAIFDRSLIYREITRRAHAEKPGMYEVYCPALKVLSDVARPLKELPEEQPPTAEELATV